MHPILTCAFIAQGATKINPYFPKGVWYLWPNTTIVDSPGANYEFDVAVDVILLALRGGSILPTQDPSQTTNER